ncbi:MAG: hypothetical protein FWD45_00165 [Coriobacteriia bacterium]|nr:hypothetical protein [Coriobacteriia bacterium]
MPRNRPVDLNNLLYEQLERISDETLTGDALAVEIQRSKAVTGLASQVIANNNTVLAALRIQKSSGGELSLPKALLGKQEVEDA